MRAAAPASKEKLMFDCRLTMARIRAEVGVPKIVMPGDSEPGDWIGPSSYRQTSSLFEMLKEEPA